MRLGAYPCILTEDSLAARCYNAQEISERHRHRYEFNNLFETKLQEAGLQLSGKSPDGRFVEIIELAPKEHPFFLATQFHPEYQSRPHRPHPLFAGFLQASLEKSNSCSST
jgi:CTP synthase